MYSVKPMWLPPQPKPTNIRRIIRIQTVGESALSRPHTPMKSIVAAKHLRRPMRSDSIPKAFDPKNIPMKTQLATSEISNVVHPNS